MASNVTTATTKLPAPANQLASSTPSRPHPIAATTSPAATTTPTTPATHRRVVVTHPV